MKTIVFARNSPTPRLYNEVYALKQKREFKLIFLCGTFNKSSIGLFSKVFDEIISIKPPVLDYSNYGLAQDGSDSLRIHEFKNIINPWFDKLANPISKKRWNYFLKTLDADIYNCRDTYELTRNVIETTKKPTIIDLQDGHIVAGVNNLTDRVRQTDQFCFENAAGIIHRGPQSEIEYYKKHGYDITCPTFRYLDYCNNDFMPESEVKKLSDDDGEPHLVAMGAGMNDKGLAPMIKNITGQKIHFHLYLVPHSWVDIDRFRVLKNMASSNNYFHMECPVPFNIVPSEIAKYDFGIKIDPDDHLAPMSKDYLKLGVPYRRNTWLEASLPIIVSSQWVSLSEWIKKHDIGFSIKNKELDKLKKEIEKHDYKKMKKNVIEYRTTMMLDKYMDNLAEYYDVLFEKYYS